MELFVILPVALHATFGSQAKTEHSGVDAPCGHWSVAAVFSIPSGTDS